MLGGGISQPKHQESRNRGQYVSLPLPLLIFYFLDRTLIAIHASMGDITNHAYS